MRHPGVPIGVRVLSENEGGGAVQVRRNEAVCEALGKLERVPSLGSTKVLGNGGRVGAEDGMRVNWTETERLPGLNRLVCDNGGGGKAGEKKRNEQQLHGL